MRLALSEMLGPRLSLAGAALMGGQQGLGRWADGAYFAYDATRDKGFVNYGRRLVPLTGLSGISITRATTGYALTQQGQLVSFPSGAARITDRGLLEEGAATNLCLQSQTFGTTWSVVRCLAFGSGSVADAIAAPDGTLTADKLVEDTTASNTHRIQQGSISIAASTAYTWSVFAKAGERSIITLQFTDGTNTAFAYYTLIGAGTISSASGASATSITALADGWYRCTITMTTAGGATTGTAQIFLSTSTSSNSYTGDGSSGIYLWGAQLETGVATSYIPTTTGSATRNADVISVSVTGLTYANGVTLFGEVELASAAAANQHIIHITNTASNAARILFNSSRVARLVVGSGGSTVVDHTGGSAVAVGAIARVAARVNTNDSNVCANGTLGTADTVCALPAADPNTFVIGDQSGTGAPLCGYIRKLAVFPSAYANAALQALAPA